MGSGLPSIFNVDCWGLPLLLGSSVYSLTANEDYDYTILKST